MKVSQLIEYLKEFPQELDVVFRCFSESRIINKEDITIKTLSVEREDGWVHDERPDKPTKNYLQFPGN